MLTCLSHLTCLSKNVAIFIDFVGIRLCVYSQEYIKGSKNGLGLNTGTMI